MGNESDSLGLIIAASSVITELELEGLPHRGLI